MAENKTDSLVEFVSVIYHNITLGCVNTGFAHSNNKKIFVSQNFAVFFIEAKMFDIRI